MNNQYPAISIKQMSESGFSGLKDLPDFNIRQPATSNQYPATSNQYPATSNQYPATNI